MHLLRNEIGRIDGLRYVVDQMDFCSSVGRRALLDTLWMVEKNRIEDALSSVELYISYLSDSNKQRAMSELAIALSYLKDVNGSIMRLNAAGKGLTDIDLFELKGLALINERVSALRSGYALNLPELPDLSAMLDLLDPDGARVSSFYVADSYDPLLAGLRKQFREAESDDEREKLAIACNEREDFIRIRLGSEIYPYKDRLLCSLEILAANDFNLAKARLAVSRRWKRPSVADCGKTILRRMQNPELASLLQEKGERFQPVSIDLEAEPTVITGANMSGKSVLLKTIVLMQTLTQFGFYLPVDDAQIVPVDEIIVSIGDSQDIYSGLSSYGAEMKCLDYLIKTVKNGANVLAVIDEPARTTNPTEGLCIVNGLITILAKYDVRAVISTHYSGIVCKGARWRVKGFMEDRVSYPLEVNNLNKCIDYTLEKDTDCQVPHEAIRIAEIMGIEPELIENCKYFLNKG